QQKRMSMSTRVEPVTHDLSTIIDPTCHRQELPRVGGYQGIEVDDLAVAVQEGDLPLEAEGRALEHDLARWQGELRLLSGQLRPGEDDGRLVARLADLQQRVALIAGRVHKVRAQIRAVHEGLLDEG